MSECDCTYANLFQGIFCRYCESLKAQEEREKIRRELEDKKNSDMMRFVKDGRFSL